MKRFELLLKDDQWERLRVVADRTGESVAHHVRWMTEICEPLHNGFLSGACLTGIEAHTTSGSVWLRGF